MSRRFLELIGVITVILAVTVLLRLASVADPTTLGGLVEAAEATGEQGQTEAARAAPTPWGEADLQGIWTTQYEIPLQRPARFADQEFFTEEQRAELDGERARIIGSDSRRSPRGSEQDVGGAYSAAIYLSHKQTGTADVADRGSAG